MPYIPQKYRQQYNEEINDLCNKLDHNGFHPGHINYCITKILLHYWHLNSRYSTGNIIIGVIDCVKQEFYRRWLAKYEDKKIEEEGDVI